VESTPNVPVSKFRQIPRGVWALGFVSLFMDVSSEMIHALLPIYLVTVLGASALTIGFIEGVAEATANITKIFSGALSDWLGKRKLLAGIGYGLAAFTKPVFPLASSVGWVVAARFIDRIGKGIRGAPRDALVADIAPDELRGASFGLRQALDTVGAFLGPLAAIGLMAASDDNFKLVFWIAVFPAFIAFGLLLLGVEEPARRVEAKPKPRLRLADAKGLHRGFWMVVTVSTVLTLARFSEAFLVLRAQMAGLPLAFIPLVLVVMNIIYALSAYPAGALSDRIGRQGVLIAGVAFLIIADLVLARGDTVPVALAGVVFWGLHMGFTQGLLSAMVADTAPATLRGTAFGVFNFATGIAMLAASILAGALWDVYGPAATFLAGAAITTLSLVGFILLGPRGPGKIKGSE
jgi:MFS family permease